jgi:hypothetical protein
MSLCLRSLRNFRGIKSFSLRKNQGFAFESQTVSSQIGNTEFLAALETCLPLGEDSRPGLLALSICVADNQAKPL